MGRNVATAGSGSSAPSAGVSFDGMPTYGNGEYINVGYLFTKAGPSSVFARSSPSFWSGINPSSNTGSFITTCYAANTWYTIVSTTGTRGKLVNVLPPVQSLAGNTEVEITIDGIVHTYNIGVQGGGYATVLGDFVRCFSTPSIAAPLSQNDLLGVLGSYTDIGFGVSQYGYIPAPFDNIRNGAPYLSWTTDMQVRVRMTSDYTTTTALNNYAAALYRIEG